MIFPNINRVKYFPRVFVRHPVYICLLLLLFSVASIIAQQVESIIIDRLEKHIFDDKISTPAEAISYADFYGGYMWGGQIHGHHPDHSTSDQTLFVIVSPVENGNNEMDVLVTIVEPNYTDLSEDVFDAPLNTDTELIGNSDLTIKEKHSIAFFLSTLSDGSEQNQP